MGLLRKEDFHESFLNSLNNPNLLINGDFQVWQRGNIINCKSGVQYAADRWALWCGNDGSIFENKLWYADWTSTGNDNLIQIIEMPLRNVGLDLVFSISMNIPEGEYVAVRIGGSQTGSVSDDSGFIYDEVIFVGTGEFKDYNFAINRKKNNSKYCKVVLKTSITGKISLTNAKLEVGTNATKFISRLYGEELALCQRYYEIINRCIGYSNPTIDNARAIFPFKMTKRTIPTITYSFNNHVNKFGLVKFSSGELIEATPITQIITDEYGIIVDTNFGFVDYNLWEFKAIIDNEIY